MSHVRMSSVRKEMAEIADLKHMVMTFRVAELQVLLGFAGRNKTGRKQELLSRAINLVQKGCSMPVQIKIRELYKKINEQLFLSARRRFPTGKPPGASEISGTTQSPLPDYEDDPPSPVKDKENSPIPPIDHRVSEKTAEISSLQTADISSLRSLPTPCGVDYGKHVPMMPPSRAPNSVPVHPDVRLKVLPFYDVQGELLKPSSLLPRLTVRFQENYFVFHLTPQQAQDIAMSRDYRPGAKSDYLVQVQLRFCLLETSCEQDDNFPPSICVRVNGKMAALPNPIPSSKPGVEPRRPSRPVDITPLCRLSPTSSNHVDVSWASELGRGYCVAIYLVKKLSSDILFSRLKQRGTKHPDHSRALIKEKLSHDPDSEIATTSLRVSLCCPLGKMKMQNPCRASTCSHLQCFDACTFLMMNEKKPTWTCPVCDKPAPFNKLIIDGLFVEILLQAGNCTEIQFSEDCTWKPLKANDDSKVITSSIIDASPSSSSALSVTKTEPSDSSSKKPSPEVIDLTVDSSDDDDDDDDDDPIETSPPPKLTRSGCVSPPLIPKLEPPSSLYSQYSPDPHNQSCYQPITDDLSSFLYSQPIMSDSTFASKNTSPFTARASSPFSANSTPFTTKISSPFNTTSTSPFMARSTSPFVDLSLQYPSKSTPSYSTYPDPSHSTNLYSAPPFTSTSPSSSKASSLFTIDSYSGSSKTTSPFNTVSMTPVSTQSASPFNKGSRSPFTSKPTSPYPVKPKPFSVEPPLHYGSKLRSQNPQLNQSPGKSVSMKCRLDSPPPAHSSKIKSVSCLPVSFKSYRSSPYPPVSVHHSLYPGIAIPGLSPFHQQYYQEMYKMLQLNQSSANSQFYPPQSFLTSPLNLSKRPVVDSDDTMTS